MSRSDFLKIFYRGKNRKTFLSYVVFNYILINNNYFKKDKNTNTVKKVLCHVEFKIILSFKVGKNRKKFSTPFTIYPFWGPKVNLHKTKGIYIDLVWLKATNNG